MGVGLHAPATLGLICLVVGEVVALLTWITIVPGLGRLSEGIGWVVIVGFGPLAWVGSTVAIVIAGLSFSDEQRLTEEAKSLRRRRDPHARP